MDKINGKLFKYNIKNLLAHTNGKIFTGNASSLMPIESDGSLESKVLTVDDTVQAVPIIEITSAEMFDTKNLKESDQTVTICDINASPIKSPLPTNLLQGKAHFRLFAIF